MASSMHPDRVAAGRLESPKCEPLEGPSMTDDRERDLDVATVRERVDEADVDASDDVLDRLATRVDEADGADATEAFASWYRECRRERRSTAEDVEAAATRFRDLLAGVDPADREHNQVRARIDEYESQFEAFRAELSTAADRLDATSREPGSAVDLYTGAERLVACERAVHEVAHGLHHVEGGLDEFESWLHDPEARFDAFREELGGFERYLDNTAGLLDRIEAGDGDDDRAFDRWLAAYHLQRVMGVILDELRADVDELEAWLGRREGAYDDELSSLRDRVTGLSERHATCSRRLDATAEAIDGFEESWNEVTASVESFESTLESLDPPVDWAAVESLVDEQFDELSIEVR
ncbi:hypothetical protein [Haloplanus salinarum]|uniref:hypothetical protein n=2 Tax=Haloplanus salinarum TaxID=1912324 RepID=UPI00214C1C57|nr:hypothetical protein [Haloplanus salinarum]